MWPKGHYDHGVKPHCALGVQKVWLQHVSILLESQSVWGELVCVQVCKYHWFLPWSIGGVSSWNACTEHGVFNLCSVHPCYLCCSWPSHSSERWISWRSFWRLLERFLGWLHNLSTLLSAVALPFVCWIYQTKVSVVTIVALFRILRRRIPGRHLPNLGHMLLCFSYSVYAH